MAAGLGWAASCGARATHDSVGHQVVPLQLAAAVFLPVELLHLWDVVLELHRQADGDAVAAPRPRARVQDLYVDRVCPHAQ